MSNYVILAIAALFGIVVVYLVVFRVPHQLTRNTPTSDIERLKLQNEIRGTLLQATAGALFLVTAATTVIQLRQDSEKAGNELETAREQQLSDRFASALTLLAHEDSTVQVGSVYALRSIADDSRYYQAPIIDTMTALVRERAATKKSLLVRTLEPNTCKSDDRTGRSTSSGSLTPSLRTRSPVVQTVLDVLGGWDLSRKSAATLNLEGVDLRAAEMYYSHLEHALLFNAQL